MLKRLQFFPDDLPLSILCWVGIAGVVVLCIMFIRLDIEAIRSELPDCPYLVFDFTTNQNLCVSPADYEAYWRGECPGAEAANGVFECQKS